MLTSNLESAGIGFGPNGMLAMDLLAEGFRPKYEAICVGNKSEKDQHIFFEGLLCEEGLGKVSSIISIGRRSLTVVEVLIRTGMSDRHGEQNDISGSQSVCPYASLPNIEYASDFHRLIGEKYWTS